MRHTGRWLLVSLLLSCCAGCNPMFYPLARAFGGAKESELKISRQAFTAMRAEIRTGSLVVFPALVTDSGGKPEWNADAARGAVEFLRRELTPAASATSEIPAVPDAPSGKNQLRYHTRRRRSYADWVGSRRPAGDRFVFMEVLEAGGRIVGGYIFIVDASGRIAYSRIYNSHWFDPAQMAGVDAFLEWMLKGLLRDLDRDPEEIFPPYGVG